MQTKNNLILSDKLNLLNKVVLECVQVNGEATIVKKIINTLIIALKADFGFSFFHTENQEFKLLYKTASTPYIPAAPRKEGIVSRAFSTKIPQLVADVENSYYVKADAKETMSSVAVVPITYKKHNYGTLHICFLKKHNFSKEDEELCIYAGNSAAQAITINRFYSQLEDLVKERTGQLEQINKNLEQDKVKDEAILDSIGEGIIATDERGTVIMLNFQAEKLIGLDQKEAIGLPVDQAMPLYGEDKRLIIKQKRPVFKALGNKRKVKIRNLLLSKNNGRQIPVSITAAPIILNGKVIGTIQVISDITQEKAVDRAKSELISLASHQLRTPLSAINWYAEALLKKELGPLNREQLRYLGEINNANRKMIELVYDFLNVSRIELGTFNIQLSELDPKEIAQNVIKELRPAIGKKRLQLRENYNKSLCKIFADRKIIRIILQNLLSNAVKYTPRQGKICLNMGLQGKQRRKTLAIRVSDTGYGIPKNQQNKVFSKLFRGDNIAAMDTEGTGLGLYIVKSFVDLCKGKIYFKSEQNKGTSFYISLPLPSQKIRLKTLDKK
ncbi:MAG: ATP-binding protein [Patescibacteria group bacterium]|nr:ATP-binding protein [Patescibacteria group bacterium]